MAAIPYSLVRDGIAIAGKKDEVDVPWWSFTKTVLAAAALVLVRDERVGLDEPLHERP